MAPRRAREPDGDGFMAQVRASDLRMRALAYSMLGSADAMDDVLHDAYLKAFRAHGRFRGESSFTTWLGAIVYRCCLDHLRSEGRHRDRTVVGGDSAALLDDLPDRSQPEHEVDTRIDVTAALRRLSPDHRAVLVLIDLQGLALAEAAEVLSLPVGTVGSRLARARAALRAIVNLPTDHCAAEGTR